MGLCFQCDRSIKTEAEAVQFPDGRRVHRSCVKEMNIVRDPERIDPLIAKLAEAWKLTPDWRFGQFMSNFFATCQVDPFYVEDDRWLAALQAYIDGKEPKSLL